LPFVRAVHADPTSLPDVDSRCDAFSIARVTNRASRTQGRALAATAARVFPQPALAALDEQVRSRRTPAHLAPISGAVLRHLEIAERDALAWYLFGTLRTAAAAAVRLGVIGPHEAQRLLHAKGPLLDRVLAECATRSPDDVAQPAPRLELAAAMHDRLYSRLFQS
jgi:urease accessory protein